MPEHGMPRAKAKRKDGSAPVLRVTKVFLIDCLWDTVPERLRRNALQQERSYQAGVEEQQRPGQRRAVGQLRPGHRDGAAGAPQAGGHPLQEQQALVAKSSGQGGEAQACAPAAGQGPGASADNGASIASPASGAADTLAAVLKVGAISLKDNPLNAAAPSAAALTPSGAALPGHPAGPDSSAACWPVTWVVLEERGWQAVWEGSQGSVYFGNEALGLTQWEVPPCLAHWDWAAWAEEYRHHLLHQQHPQQGQEGQSQQQVAGGPGADLHGTREPVQQERLGDEVSLSATSSKESCRDEVPLSAPSLLQGLSGGHPGTSLKQGTVHPGGPAAEGVAGTPLGVHPGGPAAEGVAGTPLGVPGVFHEQLERELLQVQETQGLLKDRGTAASAPATQGRHQELDQSPSAPATQGRHQELDQSPSAPATQGRHQQLDQSPREGQRGRKQLRRGPSVSVEDVAMSLTAEQCSAASLAPPCTSSSCAEGLPGGCSPATAQGVAPCCCHCLASCAHQESALSLLLPPLRLSLVVAWSLGITGLLWLKALWRPREDSNTGEDDGKAAGSSSLPCTLPLADTQQEPATSTSPLPVTTERGAGVGTEAGSVDGRSLRPSPDSGGATHGSQGLGPASASVEKEVYRQYAANMPADMPAECVRYWAQRYSLFALFDAGVRMAPDSWYSVTPQVLAEHHAQRCRGGVAVDAFCGVGGNAIQLAFRCQHVIAIDVEPAKLHLASWNLALYKDASGSSRGAVKGEAQAVRRAGSPQFAAPGPPSRVDFVVGDCLQLLPSLQADVVFLSPPWGGPSYLSAKEYDTSTMLLPVSGYQILQLALACAPRVALFLPRNTPLEHLKHLWISVAPQLPCEVETAYLNGRVKAITMYIGHFDC